MKTSKPSLFLVLLAVLAGCGGGAADSGADTGLTGDACAQAQPVSWDSFGHAFLIASCNTCHAATSLDRYDAPKDVVFDTVDDAWAWSDRILARAAPQVGEATMPPATAASADDQTRLRWWLACGVSGT